MSTDDAGGTDPLANLSHEEKRAIAELAKARVNEEINRRDILKMAGVLGGGAVIGGGASAAALEATGDVRAGTAESGTVGTDANPVDVIADDVQAVSLDNDGSAITIDDDLDFVSSQIAKNLAEANVADTGTDPANNGEIRNNGGVLKAKSGGTVADVVGSSTGLSDSGTDTADGGDIWQLPAVEDAIDLQGGGELQDAEAATVADSAADPTANGEIRRNGSTLKVQSDGQVANIINKGPLYGDESDGAITDSANTTRGGILQVTDYTVDSGVTVTVDSATGFLIVLATGTIDVSGTIDGKGQGGSGGSAGTSGSRDGGNGGSGWFSPLQLGGAGGSGGLSGLEGGDGGDGDTGTPTYQTLIPADPFGVIDGMRDQNGVAGAGGGGGSAGTAGTSTTANGADGSFPGGGGGGASDSSGSGDVDGGAGGSGGAFVLLVAPQIDVSGTIQADGENGGAGTDGEAPGGGGGGGSGGFVGVLAQNLTNNGTLTASAGSGGAAGSDTGDGNETAGSGATGAAGVTYTRG